MTSTPVIAAIQAIVVGLSPVKVPLTARANDSSITAVSHGLFSGGLVEVAARIVVDYLMTNLVQRPSQQL